MRAPSRSYSLVRLFAFVGLIALIASPASGARRINIPNPDFTKGDPIPEQATHDWTLGATGARGWIYSEKLETSKARQIRITEVAESTPADGVLEVGDVILGIGNQAFTSDARQAFGEALTAAESTEGNDQLLLLRWRNPAPSGIMFADGIRLEGLQILSEWKVAEGIDACMFYLKNQNHWASEKRMTKLLEILRSYGAHAKRTIPELEELATQFAAGKPSYFPEHLSQRKADDVRKTIQYLEETEERPELITISAQ